MSEFSNQITKANTKAIVASLTIGFSVFGLTACSGGSSSQPIQNAPASPMTSHLKQCYATKLSGSARTVIREKILVCRRDSNSQPVEQELTPRFQIGRTKGNKIGFRQVIAVKFSGSSSGTEAASSERIALNAAALEFLTKGCAPIINAVFQRSGFESSHRFQVFKEGDPLALSSEVAKNGTVADEFEFGESRQFKPSSIREAPVATRPQEDDGTKRVYHLLLEMKLSKENGLRLVDEIADVESGTLVGYTPTQPGASIDPADGIQTARLQFCGQLAMRVAENYGLTEGRDCESMSGRTSNTEKDSAKSDLSKKGAIGLMKPGKTLSDLAEVKLANREIHDILTPVCGTLKDQKGL